MAASTVAMTFPGVGILERTPRTLRALLAAATQEDLDWQPRPERWSISMVLAHLADVEEKGFVSRFRAMASEDNPHLPAYDQLALFRSGAKFDGLAELDKFERQRGETLAWLTSLPDTLSGRTGRHEKLGPITFGQLLNEFAFHDLGHIRQIIELYRSHAFYRTWACFNLSTRSVREPHTLMPSLRWRMMLAMKASFALVLLCPAFGLFAAPQAGGAPSVDQILDHYVQAVGGKDAIQKVTSRAMKGTLENSDDGTTSPAEIFTKAPNKYLAVVSLGDAGQMLEGWNGETGWGKDPDSGLHDIGKVEQIAAKRDYDFYRETRLKELFPKMALSGKTKVDDRDAYIIEATSPDGAIEKLYFDVESGLLVRRDFERVNIDDGIVLYEMDYDDYKDVDGLKLPSTVRRKTPDYTLTYRFTEIKHNVPVDDAKFNKPEK